MVAAVVIDQNDFFDAISLSPSVKRTVSRRGVPGGSV